MTYPGSRHKLICLALSVSATSGCQEKTKAPRLDAIIDTPTIPSSRPPSPTSTTKQDCPRNVRPHPFGRVEEPFLKEISGLVASQVSSNLLWVHNDSGDQAKIYALSPNGTQLGTLEIPRVARDWEDIALEHREASPDRLYVADIGDNLNTWKDGVFIHRFTEPTLEDLRAVHPAPLRINDVETMTLRFPSGPVDAEALIVDHDSGQLVLISKPRLAPPEIYEVQAFSHEATLTHVGTLSTHFDGQPLHLVTAADLSPDGGYVILRTYAKIVVFPRKKGQSVSDALLSGGCSIKPAHENQGEAVGFLGPDRVAPQTEAAFPRFVTIGEGANQPVYIYERRAPQPLQEPKGPSHE